MYVSLCFVIIFFLHYPDPKVKLTVVRMKIQTDVDMTDPATNTQIQTLREKLHASLLFVEMV